MLACTSILFLVGALGIRIRLARKEAAEHIRVGYEQSQIKNTHYANDRNGSILWIRHVHAENLTSSGNEVTHDVLYRDPVGDIGADQRQVPQGVASQHAMQVERNASQIFVSAISQIFPHDFVSFREEPMTSAEKPKTPAERAAERVQLAKDLELPEFLQRRAEVMIYLGAGGFGKVFQLAAKETCMEDAPGTDEYMAVKVMELAALSDKGQTQLRREAEIMYIMGRSSEYFSEYVIYLVGPPIEYQNKVFLTMPYLNQGEFFDLIVEPKEETQLGQLPDEKIQLLRQLPMQVALWFQAVKGVAALHWSGITHMDIKPENVMIDCKKGRPCHATVIDLGIACVSTDSRFFQWPTYPCPETTELEKCIDDAYQQWRKGLNSGTVIANKHHSEDPASTQENELFFTTTTFRRVYNKDRLPFTDLKEVLLNEKHYPVTFVYYNFPTDCGFRGTFGYASPEEIKIRNARGPNQNGNPSSPEEIKNAHGPNQHGNPSNDIWALGTMLYSIASTLNPPWKRPRDSDDTVFEKIVEFSELLAEERRSILIGAYPQLETTPKLLSLILRMLVQQEQRVDAGEIMTAMPDVMTELAPGQVQYYVDMINTLPSDAGAMSVPPACLAEEEKLDIKDGTPERQNCFNDTVKQAELSELLGHPCDPCCECKVMRNGKRVTGYFRMQTCN